MGVDPVTLAIGGAAVMGTLGATGAASGNSNIRKAISSARDSAARQSRQTALSGALERQKQIDIGQQVVGSIRVAAGSAGVQDYANVEDNAIMEADLNRKIVEADTGNKIDAIRSEYTARATALNANHKSVLLEGATGALQGALMGYAVGNIFAGLGASSAAAVGNPAITGGTVMYAPLEYQGFIIP